MGPLKPPSVVHSVGHSTRPLGDLIALLRAHDVRTVADVRTVPRSRRNPQFNRETLHEHLAAAGLRYVHLPGLGGLRRPRPDSRNLGWRNASLRGYADYMQSPEFGASLDALLRLARATPIAVMCAEAVPWRCHRSLIADALLVRDVQVDHIMSPTRRDPHVLTSWAWVEGVQITYPART